MSDTIRKLSVVDSAFLFGETAECPMHVGSLTIVKQPDGYDGDFYEDFKGMRLETIITGAPASKELANPMRSLVPYFADMPTFGTPMLLQLLAVFMGRSQMADRIRPPMNVVVSNVFFSQTPFYVAGAQIEHVYPMSIPVHGQALNITVHGYVDSLDFGLIAGANVVPNVDHIARMLPEELAKLESAYGIAA